MGNWKKKKVSARNAILGSLDERDYCQAGRDIPCPALCSFAALTLRKIKQGNVPMQWPYTAGLFTSRSAFCITLQLAAGKAKVFQQLQSALCDLYKNGSFEERLFPGAQHFQAQLLMQLCGAGTAEVSQIQQDMRVSSSQGAQSSPSEPPFCQPQSTRHWAACWPLQPGELHTPHLPPALLSHHQLLMEAVITPCKCVYSSS